MFSCARHLWQIKIIALRQTTDVICFCFFSSLPIWIKSKTRCTKSHWSTSSIKRLKMETDGNVHNNRSTIHWNFYQFVVGKPELFYQLEIRFCFGEFLFQVLLAFIRRHKCLRPCLLLQTNKIRRSSLFPSLNRATLQKNPIACDSPYFEPAKHSKFHFHDLLIHKIFASNCTNFRNAIIDMKEFTKQHRKINNRRKYMLLIYWFIMKEKWWSIAADSSTSFHFSTIEKHFHLLLKLYCLNNKQINRNVLSLLKI